jgi:hypothetical protein
VGDLPAMEGVVFLTDAGSVIVRIDLPAAERAEEAEVAAEGEEGAPAEGAEGEAPTEGAEGKPEATE